MVRCEKQVFQLTRELSDLSAAYITFQQYKLLVRLGGHCYNIKLSYRPKNADLLEKAVLWSG
jgi:hypothetical protein